MPAGIPKAQNSYAVRASKVIFLKLNLIFSSNLNNNLKQRISTTVCAIIVAKAVPITDMLQIRTKTTPKIRLMVLDKIKKYKGCSESPNERNTKKHI